LLGLATIVAESPQHEVRMLGLAANSVVQMFIKASTAHAPKKPHPNPSLPQKKRDRQERELKDCSEDDSEICAIKKCSQFSQTASIK
jgi:hypothetical protein